MLETICDILVESYRRGWITSRDGNISIRHNGQSWMYVTPSGVRKTTLQPDQFKKIAIETGEELPYTDISKNLRPSGELPLHWGLQRTIPASQEIRVVTHVHATHIVAAMHAGVQLDRLVDNFPELSRYTRVASNVGIVPPISQELADQCLHNLGLKSDGTTEYDIVGIAGHGVVAIDCTPWRSFEHIERLNHIAEIVLASGNY